MRKAALLLGCLAILLAGTGSAARAGDAKELSALERYRRLQYAPVHEHWDQEWRERVALEFEIINHPDVTELRAALRDENVYVRCMAAHALGILGDRSSANALAELLARDPEYSVRIRAVEALGYLKAKPEVIAAAKKDADGGVQWSARTVEGMVTDPVDHAAQARAAYAGGIRTEDMGRAQVGRRAPDFTVRRSSGEPFRLSSVLGKKPIAIYFTAFDG